jgi:Ca-activated chloride channel homolog
LVAFFLRRFLQPSIEIALSLYSIIPSNMRVTLILLTSIFTYSLSAQIVFEKTKHDFGDLSLTSERFVDMVVTNKGVKKEYLLSVKKPAQIVYLVNGQFMEKDSSLVIRLQINQKTKGRFSYEVEIYTSDKNTPTVLKLTGNILESNTAQNHSFQACPDFNSTPQSRARATDFELTVVTIDKTTKELLHQSSVTLLQNGQPLGIHLTDKKGEVKQKIPLGFTYFYATHPHYHPAEIGGYVNFQRNYVVLELEKKPIPSIPIHIEDPAALVATTTPEDKKTILTIPINEELQNQLREETQNQISTSANVLPVKLADLDNDNFESTNFKPINVTFVLDISASMRAGEKMELMKFSLYQLTDMLRQEDKISLVTYATDSRVLLPTTSGKEKETIKKMVAALKAGGLTAGGAGIKLGYQQVLKAHIPEGTNHIIIITDGAFNRNSDDYKKYIKKYKKKGVNMSVVGILNSERDKKDMEEAAALGGGRYVPVYKLADALNNLKQEIRLITFRQNE